MFLATGLALASLTLGPSPAPTSCPAPQPFTYNLWVRTLPVTLNTTFCDTSVLERGANTPCPCENHGAPGFGCDNAQSTGGVRLQVVDQTVGPQNRATLQGLGFPTSGAPGVVLIRSNTFEVTSVPFGDGIRCVGSLGLVRLGASVARDGTSTHVFGHGAKLPGTYFYQAWYRNTPAAFCDPSAAFNLSSGNSLIW